MRDLLRLVVVFGVTGWWLVWVYAATDGMSFEDAVLGDFAGIVWFNRAAITAWVLLVLGGWTIWRGSWVWPFTTAIASIGMVPYYPVGRVQMAVIFGIIVLYGVIRLVIRKGSFNGERREERARDHGGVGTAIR